jgi:hypothetical protein
MRESYARFFHRARHSARTTAWLALRESVEEVMQTIENDGLLQRMAREMSSARVFRCRDQPLAPPARRSHSITGTPAPPLTTALPQQRTSPPPSLLVRFVPILLQKSPKKKAAVGAEL